jgi:hypothetical protein
MATAKKAPAKKATAKKAPARKAAPKKPVEQPFSLRAQAEKAFNVYLGVIGKGLDRVQENIDNARKENEKRVKEYEKRGVKFRKDLNKRIDGMDIPEFDDVKAQFNKVQDRVEDAVEDVKERFSTAKAA